MPKQIAELAVLVAGRFPLLVLLPEEHQRKVLVGEQFIVQVCPVGRCPSAGYVTGMDRIEQAFQPLIVKVGRQWPRQPGGRSTAQGVGNGCPANVAGSGYGLSGLPAQPSKAEYLSYLSHGNSILWHRGPP